MSFLDNIMNKVRRDDGDDGYLDDDYADEYPEEEFQEESAHKSSRFSGIFGHSDPKVIDGGASSGMRVTTLKPTGMEDCKEICNCLLDGKAVILNMEGIGTDVAQRIIDFTLGSIYAIDGNIQQVSKYIFIATPSSVELSGDFVGDFAGKAMQTAAPKQPAYETNGFRFNG